MVILGSMRRRWWWGGEVEKLRNLKVNFRGENEAGLMGFREIGEKEMVVKGKGDVVEERGVRDDGAGLGRAAAVLVALVEATIKGRERAC